MVDFKSEVIVEVSKEDNGSVIDFKMVTFILAGKEYGVEIMNVKEIQKGSRFTFVPNAPSYVRGVYNLRGDIIPVIDLRRFFEIPGEKEKTSFEDILILREKGSAVGVIVDSIQKVIGVSSKDIQPSHPLFSDVVGLDYIYGVVEKDKYLYVILDTSVILSGGEKGEVKLEELEQGFIDENNVRVQKNVVDLDILKQQEVSVIQEPLQSHESIVKEKDFKEEKVSMIQEPLQFQESLVSNNDLELEETIPDSFLERLFKCKGFCATELNEKWLQSRYNQWVFEDGNRKTTLVESEYEDEDIVSFFESFYSRCSKKLWEEQLLDELYKLIFEFSKRTVYVWDVNCGSGFSTYSIAGGFFLRNQPCKIYATDSNLEVVMNASGIIFKEDSIPNDLKLAMVEGKQGWQFSNEVKNKIIFEYHNLSNDHIFPRLDVILARDILSFVNEEEYMKFFEKVDKQVDEGCLLIVGDNEVITGRKDWIHVPCDYFSVYKKVF